MLAKGHPTRQRTKHMASDAQGDMITALENYAQAIENGTLNHQIIRALVQAINAAR